MPTVRVHPFVLAIAFLLLTAGAQTPVLGTCNNAPVVSPWTDLDIGDCGPPHECPPGSATYDSGTGRFTITSTRFTISGTADKFNFLYREFTGDFDFRARLISLTDPILGVGNRQSSAGLMVRANLLEGSRHYFLEYSNWAPGPADPDPGTNPAARTWSRTWNNDPAFANVPVPTFYSTASCDCSDIFGCCGLPQYQRIVRLGDQITGYWSSDGTTWNTAYGETLTDLPAGPVPVYIGLAIRSSNADCGSVTAIYDQVTVTAPSLPHQTFWLGNSFPGGTTHIQNNLTAMYLHRGPNLDPRTGQMVNEPRLYTNSIWDEAGTEAVILDGNGKIERALKDTH